MKKIFLVIIVFTISFVTAQEQNSEKKTLKMSLSKRFDVLEKKLDKFNFYFNFQGSFDTQNNENEDFETNFKVRQLHLEVKGNLTDKLFYRLRHRLNVSNQGKTLDNLAEATDIFYAGYHFNDKFTIIFGKQFQYWGGYEYDLTPIYVYEFSDFNYYIDCFMLGATFIYSINKNNSLTFQITNNRANKFEDIYDDLSKQNIKKSKTPLTYILNWSGNLWDNLFYHFWDEIKFA